jgi:hypothetical protein
MKFSYFALGLKRLAAPVLDQGFSTFWYLGTPNQDCTPLRTQNQNSTPSCTPQLKKSTQINLF